jgi:predicted nucleic acid-binding protein
VRAVIDPNVLISGLLSPAGSPAQVLRAWQHGRVEVLVSPLLLDEFTRALAYPKLRERIPADDAAEAVRRLADGATQVDDPPDDQRAALVSGDRHLLALSEHIPVYAPRAFLDELS